MNLTNEINKIISKINKGDTSYTKQEVTGKCLFMSNIRKNICGLKLWLESIGLELLDDLHISESHSYLGGWGISCYMTVIPLSQSEDPDDFYTLRISNHECGGWGSEQIFNKIVRNGDFMLNSVDKWYILHNIKVVQNRTSSISSVSGNINLSLWKEIIKKRLPGKLYA